MIAGQRHVCQPEAKLMHVWTVSEPGIAADAAQAALIGMIPHLGSPGFKRHALAAINLGLASGSWSVYRIRRDAPPVCYLSESHGRPDTTPACLHAYRTWLYRHDRTFEALSDGAIDRVRALHLTAADVPDARHRHAIYERHQLRERLSVAAAGPDDSILSVNLYRHADQPGFGERELALFSHLAPGLFAMVARQIELCAPAASLPGGLTRERYRDILLQLEPALPQRELDVCVRLLGGMSHDGIACDLGISATTVKTYRNRAYARFGIHHNNELFALALERAGPRS
jgi:DNA-binding CsgD family transcriptional regulator